MIGFVLPLVLQGASPLLEIPREYWGEYNDILKDCGTGLNDSRLRISWDSIRFYESEGSLKEIIRNPDGSIVVVATHKGEGATWDSTYLLRLSTDQKKLTIVHPQSIDSNQLEVGRLRCPTGSNH